MWGVPLDPQPGQRGYGYYVFKSRLNGQMVRFIGLYDLPVNRAATLTIRLAERFARAGQPEFVGDRARRHTRRATGRGCLGSAPAGAARGEPAAELEVGRAAIALRLERRAADRSRGLRRRLLGAA